MKKKNLNYNYVFVFYDVKEERVNKVFKVCKNIFHIFKNQYLGEKLLHQKL